MRLKLFQGVLVIAGRDNYVNKIDTNPPVAALYFEMDYKGRRKGNYSNQAYS